MGPFEARPDIPRDARAGRKRCVILVFSGRPVETLKLSTHYYVLSLGEGTNRLYEAFRESLIDIHNTWFPLESPPHRFRGAMNDAQLHTLFQTVDEHFAHYYRREPLGVVLAGTERHQSAFASLTAYPGVIIGRVEGNHSTTSETDLGNIVWPLVKRAMANAGRRAARELRAAVRAENVAVGIDAVLGAVQSGAGVTLWVEDGLRVDSGEGANLLDDFDNVVDVVVEKVLARGGNVVFVEDGTLGEFQSIALILRA